MRCCAILLFALLAVRPLAAAELKASIDEALAAVPAGGRIGIAIADLDDDRWLYRRNSAQALSLASTTKLVIAAAALHGLGTDYKFRTRLVGLGPLSVDGTLPGLGIIAGGSPCLDEHFADGRDPEAFLRGFVAELKRQGVLRIAGDLVIDDRLLSGPSRAPTWPQDVDNQQRWFCAPASAFAWNDNCIEVRLVPTVAGQPCEVQTRPRSSRIIITNQTRTDPKAAVNRHAIARELRSNTIIVSGPVARTTAWFPLAIRDDPALLHGDHLKGLLVAAGIAVSGEVRLGEVAAEGGPLLVDLQQPLVPAVTLMNQHSQNFYAEQLLRLIGVARSGDGSLVAGCPAVLAVLTEKLGAGAGDMQLLDGSGLSYDNRASAEYLVNLLDGMHHGPLAKIYADSLKERSSAGVRGLVKTGTHAQASCLAGYLAPTGGHRYGFAILLNRGDASSMAWGERLRWKLFDIMAAGVR